MYLRWIEKENKIMNKKYEEMTREQLGKEADEILKRLQLLVCAGELDPYDISELGKIINTMKDYKENKTAIKIGTMKEKVDNILGSILNRNKDYAIEAYISNGMTDSNIGQIIIPTDRIYNEKDKKFMIEWNKDVNSNVRYNNLSFPYDEVMACYEEVDSYGELKISESAIVILKNGMKIDFECVGMRI